MKMLPKIIVLLFCQLFLSVILIGQPIRVMTFNIRFDNPNDGKNIWENRKTEVLELIKYYHPGFFGLQEAMNNQLEFINDGLKDYAFIGVGREDGKQKGEYTPIFFDSTSFQLISHHTFWLSETADEVSVGWDAALERICTYGLFMDKETGDSIHVFNTHFDHMGKVARLMSAKLIEQKIDGVASGSSFIILMGDLNCTPESEPFQVLQEELDYGAEISLKGLYGPDGTFNGYVEDLVMTERIDHIFTRNFKVNSYRHIDDRMKNNGYLSDHLPVIAEIEVK